MIIPFIDKDARHGDFDCRDGEIDFSINIGSASSDSEVIGASALPTLKLMAEGTVQGRNLRIPLLAGERQKAELMLSGEISRVDPATADRITHAIVEKAAEALLDISTDLRRQGLFLLPFRFFTMLMKPDGTLSFPSPQGVALPTDYPPHPEITAASATDDCLTLAIRFPVRPHRLVATPSPNLPASYTTRTFISYPLYIPDPKEIRGSIGSVRSATGGNATGVRFGFLSVSAIKASVTAPEKYYELVGNERTGYRFASKAAAPPDYSCYAAEYGSVSPFPRSSMLALGEGVDVATDPLDWIADWKAYAGGYLPIDLPYKYIAGGETPEETVWPEGIDREWVLGMAETLGCRRLLLTRPMTFGSHEESRRQVSATGIRRIRMLGMEPAAPALGVLYGSDDGVRWTPLRQFDPRAAALVLAPPRLFWRLLLIGSFESVALEVS